MLKRLKENWAIVFIAGVGSILATMLFLVPQQQVKQIQDVEKRTTAENAARQTLIQLIGGCFFFITAYISLETLKATQRNVKATEDKQVAERFSKAIELLAHESTHVHLGGIYALEKIAESEDSYYWQIMETLTAYVRDQSPAPTELTDPEDAPPLPTHIQAVMTVLSRRKHSYGNGENYRLDLSETDLRRLQLPPTAKLCGVDFREANLQRADFTKVNLDQANFKKADLEKADLTQANLEKANFKLAELQEAKLIKANLQHADFMGADLQGARLKDAILLEASFAYADLQKAIFVEAKLQQASFNSAKLQQANFTNAELQQANFADAKLQKAIFWNAKLQQVNFTDAELQKAKLMGADLQEAVLQTANLQEAQFQNFDQDSIQLLGRQPAINLTWGQLNQAASYTKELLPDYLLQNPPQPLAEEAKPTEQASEGSQISKSEAESPQS